MNNSPFDIESLFSDVPLPSTIVADIEILCQGMEKMFAGQPAEMTIFSHRLASVLEWAKIRTPAEENSNTAGWRARYAGLPKLGGTLTCQYDEQELMLSMDSKNVVYMGSWRSLQPGQEDQGGIFSIEDSSSGRVLVLDTGQAKQQIPLPDSEGLTWGNVAGFLQGLQAENPQQPEPPESQLAPASHLPLPQSNVSDVELPPDAHPTILAKPVKRQPLPIAPLPSENIRSKPAPGEQPAMINPEIWQCACGNKNAGLFCPKCGAEKPTSTVVQPISSSQPAYCKTCGAVLSPGARFCRNCGAEA